MNLQEQALKLSPALSKGTAFVYILRLQSGGLYTGCSTDFETRFPEHEAGTASRTTRLDPPVSLAWIEIHSDFPSARRRESQLKRWSRAKKEALILEDGKTLVTLSQSRR